MLYSSMPYPMPCPVAIHSASIAPMTAPGPYESMDEISPWFDHCPISETGRVKIGRSNSEKLFGLHQPAAA